MKVFCFYLTAAIAATTLVSCGQGKATDPAAPSQAAKPSAAPAPAVDPASTAQITGTVILDGPPPAPNPVDMSSEPACAKPNPSSSAGREVLTGANGALANVVVFVKSGLAAYRFDTPKEPAVLDQKGCAYEPRVVALMANQPLEIHNDDATIHNVHATPKLNDEWNKAQRAGSPALKVSFPSPELAIPFMCNVHPWMRAFVFVFAHPYFAVTTTAGTFELKNLPPGTYTIEAWHERYGAQDQSVVVTPHSTQAISFRFGSVDASD
jgi:plastocyanin